MRVPVGWSASEARVRKIYIFRYEKTGKTGRFTSSATVRRSRHIPCAVHQDVGYVSGLAYVSALAYMAVWRTARRSVPATFVEQLRLRKIHIFRYESREDPEDLHLPLREPGKTRKIHIFRYCVGGG